MDAINRTIIKAVFLFPLTNALKVQHQRLLNEKDKYEVIDVDDPLQAGKILSIETCGILFCSESQKIIKCLEKYEKIFSDSKFRIILVLPKRIIGKEAADLSNRGVQDIIVEPITEKALTTKVTYNFQMILKLLDAGMKQVKILADLAKAKEEAFALKKSQDEKKKLNQDEQLIRVSGDKSWQEKEKAAHALKFKPLEGKINGTDNISKMEKSTVSLKALNIYNNQVKVFQKTLEDKFEELHIQVADKKNDYNESVNAGKNIVELSKIEISKSNTSDETIKNNISDEKKIINPDIKKVDGLKLPEQALDLNLKKANTQSSDAHKQVRKGLLPIQDVTVNASLTGQSTSASTPIQNNEKSGLLRSSNLPKMDKSHQHTSSTDKVDPSLQKSKSNFTDEGLKLNDQIRSQNSTVDNINGSNKTSIHPGTEKLDPQEVGQTHTSADQIGNILQGSLANIKNLGPVIKKDFVDQKPNIDTHSQGKTSTLDKAKPLLTENSMTTPLKEIKDVHAKSASSDVMSNPVDLGLVTNEASLAATATAVNFKDKNEILDKNKSDFKEKTVEQNIPGSGSKDIITNQENVKTSFKAETPILEVAKANEIIDTKINTKVQLEDNFVDEFTKNKQVDVVAAVTDQGHNALSDLGFSRRDIDSIIFEEAPKNIVKANLQALDIGIILLQKLSSSEQKIEEQNFVFPVIAQKMYELYQGLVSFYIIDSKGAPTLLHSSHAEKKDFYNTLKLPPIEDHVAKNIVGWSKYRYATLNDETLHSDLIELIYPIKEGAKMLGLVVVHCFRTVKESKDVSKIEMLIEFTRGYFLRFHNIGAQSSSKSKTGSEEIKPTGPWYQKYLDSFNAWLNKNKQAMEVKDVPKSKSSKNVVEIKKPSAKKGAA